MPKDVKDVDPQYLMFFPYYGRHEQDKFLHERLFGDKKNGIFVDLGAYDGIESSNTLFFEESLGWNGICVEPLPDAFSRLVVHRKCLCLNKCASDSHRKAEFIHVIPDKVVKTSEEERVPNFEKLSGLSEFYSTQHKDLIDHTLKRVGGRQAVIETECMPINEILSLIASPKIDLLTIDTEGSELHILQAIDFAKFDIEVIVLEVLYPSEELNTFMKQHGYVFVKEIGYDWIYKKVK